MHSEIILDLDLIVCQFLSRKAFSVGSATHLEYLDHCIVIIAYAQTSWFGPFNNLSILAISICIAAWYPFV